MTIGKCHLGIIGLNYLSYVRSQTRYRKQYFSLCKLSIPRGNLGTLIMFSSPVNNLHWCHFLPTIGCVKQITHFFYRKDTICRGRGALQYTKVLLVCIMTVPVKTKTFPKTAPPFLFFPISDIALKPLLGSVNHRI